eukprot:jgi/Bigna1/87560/estExt_fgenesh1_pg.C_210194
MIEDIRGGTTRQIKTGMETRTSPRDEDSRGDWYVGDYVKISLAYVTVPFGYLSYEESMNEITGRYARIVGFEKDTIALVKLSTLFPPRKKFVRVKPRMIVGKIEKAIRISKCISKIISEYIDKMVRIIPGGPDESKFIYFIPLTSLRPSTKKLFLKNAKPRRVHYEGSQIKIISNETVIDEKRKNSFENTRLKAVGCITCASLASWGLNGSCGPCQKYSIKPTCTKAKKMQSGRGK